MIRKGTTILVVDDSATLRKVLRNILMTPTTNVVTTDTAEEALELVHKEQPDLIISDVAMSGMDGFQFLYTLRENEATRHIPFIFLTGQSQEDNKATAYSLGADYFLTKPIHKEILLAHVQQIIELRDKFRALEKQRQRGFTGSLEELPGHELLQVMEMSSRTGLLRLTEGGLVAEIAFSEGQPFSAMLVGEEDGDDRAVLFEVMSWSSGEFLFDSSFKPKVRQIKDRLANLLLQWSVQQDEGRRAPKPRKLPDPVQVDSIEIRIPKQSVFSDMNKLITRYLRAEPKVGAILFVEDGEPSIIKRGASSEGTNYLLECSESFDGMVGNGTLPTGIRRLIFQSETATVIALRFNGKRPFSLYALSEEEPTHPLNDWAHELGSSIAQRLST